MFLYVVVLGIGKNLYNICSLMCDIFFVFLFIIKNKFKFNLVELVMDFGE